MGSAMDRATPPVTRFAPSPNGRLHLGHALSAIVAHDLARAGGGRFLLRIEDIDGPRSRPELADEFRRDLDWLGLEWEEVPAQSTRLASYAAAAEGLKARGILVKHIAGLHPLLANCLRLTVGAPEENDLMLAALKESL